MRNALLGSFVGVLAAFGLIVACGGSGEDGRDALVVGQDLLAIAQIEAHSSTPLVRRYVNHLGGTVTVTREGTGSYVVHFGFDLADRLWLVSAGTTDCGALSGRVVAAGCKDGEPDAVWVTVYNPTTSSFSDSGHFVVAVY